MCVSKDCGVLQLGHLEQQQGSTLTLLVREVSLPLKSYLLRVALSLVGRRCWQLTFGSILQQCYRLSALFKNTGCCLIARNAAILIAPDHASSCRIFIFDLKWTKSSFALFALHARIPWDHNIHPLILSCGNSSGFPSEEFENSPVFSWLKSKYTIK